MCESLSENGIEIGIEEIVVIVMKVNNGINFCLSVPQLLCSLFTAGTNQLYWFMNTNTERTFIQLI